MDVDTNGFKLRQEEWGHKRGQRIPVGVQGKPPINSSMAESDRGSGTASRRRHQRGLEQGIKVGYSEM